MNRNKKSLYRKVNTKKVHPSDHKLGSDFSKTRNSKNLPISKMKNKVRRGLDYSPLYQFLLGSEGKEWDKVFSSIIDRVMSIDVIFYMVSINGKHKLDTFRSSDTSYFHTMFVDSSGILRIQNKDSKIKVNECFNSFTTTLDGKVI